MISASNTFRSPSMNAKYAAATFYAAALIWTVALADGVVQTVKALLP
jgi:hypothetical protein